LEVLLAAIGGLATGFGLGLWSEHMNATERRLLHKPSVTPRAKRARSVVVMLATAALFAAYVSAVNRFGVIQITEVRPSFLGLQLRLAYHLVLISLLIVATATDFDCYIIPDQITIPGMLLGLSGAFAVGQVQLCHLWVDWNFAIPHLRGPYIPNWFDAHWHWHGLAWSTAGLVVGATITWLARAISSRVLGQEAMGLGDVTLMAMIGSFLGWQAVILVFLLAPIAGLTVGVMIKLLSGRTYLPYGPWLSLAAIFVLFRWAWLWQLTRGVFSDWLGLTILAAIGTTGFVLLLGFVLMYRAIPVHRANGAAPTGELVKPPTLPSDPDRDKSPH
jgi:leader peptidase (prepilin peptidase) / N-methyltransferase